MCISSKVYSRCTQMYTALPKLTCKSIGNHFALTNEDQYESRHNRHSPARFALPWIRRPFFRIKIIAFITIFTHLKLWIAAAIHNLMWVKITHACLIWDQRFANLDVYYFFVPNNCDLVGPCPARSAFRPTAYILLKVLILWKTVRVCDRLSVNQIIHFANNYLLHWSLKLLQILMFTTFRLQ